MAPTSLSFRLKSYQTALAIVAPSVLHADINLLRKIYDKAYERWDPHINVLYPFVDPDQLESAIAELRQRIENNNLQSFEINLPGPDKFVQKKGATVHLKPDLESEGRISRLRADLVDALGRDANEGTHDGIFRAHMTIGQAGLMGPTLGMLTDKVAKLAPLRWQCKTLAVLKRQPSGKMVQVDEIQLAGKERAGLTENEGHQLSNLNWKLCNTYSPARGWRPVLEDLISQMNDSTPKARITVSTYNLMAEPSAPALESRISLILDVISSATDQFSTPRILCLQEVDEDMLPLLLASPAIRDLYPFSTHQPSSLLPSYRNLVTLSSVPFRHTSMQFIQRHKSALIVDLFDGSVKIANVHLTSGLTDDAVLTKKDQIDLLTDFCLDQSMLKGEFIIAGDFNLTSSSRTIDTALAEGLISQETARLVRTAINTDVWQDAFVSFGEMSLSDSGADFDGEEGATFEPLENPLAAVSTTPIDDRPQRYDRVLFRNDRKLKTEQVQIFGLPDRTGHCGSDHYGFSTTLHIDEAQNMSTRQSLPHIIDGLVVIEDAADLDSLLQPWLPAEEDRKQRLEAIRLVQGALSSGNGLSNLILAPLGSYLLDTYFTDSDVDLLAIGSVAPQFFFDFATSTLQQFNTEASDGVKGVHLVNSLVSIVEICVLGIKFDLQYCQAPVLLERFHSANMETPLRELAFDGTLISWLPPSSLRPFNTYRDTAYILNTIPDLASYRTAHRFLSLFLKNRGLYSAKFGYLGGIHLSLMLNRVTKLMNSQTSRTSHGIGELKFSPATIVRTFFNYYATFNWHVESVTDPGLTGKQQLTRTSRDAVFIPAIHMPTARPNVATSCTPLSVKTFTLEFKAATEIIDQEGWDSLLRPGAGVKDFLTGFSAYVSIYLDIWDLDSTGNEKTREIIGALESKFPRLMLAISRLNGIYAQAWPRRFRGREESREDVTQFKGYYMIGIRMTDEGVDVDMKKILRGKVIAAVREFESNVKVAREFEAGNCWLRAEFLSKKKVRDFDLVIDA